MIRDNSSTSTSVEKQKYSQVCYPDPAKTGPTLEGGGVISVDATPSITIGLGLGSYHDRHKNCTYKQRTCFYLFPSKRNDVQYNQYNTILLIGTTFPASLTASSRVCMCESRRSSSFILFFFVIG